MSTTPRDRLVTTPRGLRPGDLIQQLSEDLSVGYRAVISVEVVHSTGRYGVRYKVLVEGVTSPMYFAPTKRIEVLR